MATNEDKPASGDTAEKKARNERLAVLLASGATAQSAAAKVGCCVRTVRRRLRNPTFARRVAELRGEMVRAATGRLASGMTDAAESLHLLLSSNSEVVVMRAAGLILTHGAKAIELQDVMVRVEELERRLRGEDVT